MGVPRASGFLMWRPDAKFFLTMVCWWAEDSVLIKRGLGWTTTKLEDIDGLSAYCRRQSAHRRQRSGNVADGPFHVGQFCLKSTTTASQTRWGPAVRRVWESPSRRHEMGEHRAKIPREMMRAGVPTRRRWKRMRCCEFEGAQIGRGGLILRLLCGRRYATRAN